MVREHGVPRIRLETLTGVGKYTEEMNFALLP